MQLETLYARELCASTRGSSEEYFRPCLGLAAHVNELFHQGERVASALMPLANQILWRHVVAADSPNASLTSRIGGIRPDLELRQLSR